LISNIIVNSQIPQEGNKHKCSKRNQHSRDFMLSVSLSLR